jgi:hypothetical protein
VTNCVKEWASFIAVAHNKLAFIYIPLSAQAAAFGISQFIGEIDEKSWDFLVFPCPVPCLCAL